MAKNNGNKPSAAKQKAEPAKTEQPAQPAPPAAPEPAPAETSQDPVIIEAPQDPTEATEALSPENNPQQVVDGAAPVIPTPPPVEPEVPQEAEESTTSEDDEEEDVEQEGDLRILDSNRVPDEIYEGQAFVVGLNRKVPDGAVITKKLKTGEHSFRVAAYHGDMQDDAGKTFHNYLVTHVYDKENPLEKNIPRSFIRGKFDIVEE